MADLRGAARGKFEFTGLNKCGTGLLPDRIGVIGYRITVRFKRIQLINPILCPILLTGSAVPYWKSFADFYMYTVIRRFHIHCNLNFSCNN